MKLTQLNQRNNLENIPKLQEGYNQLSNFIKELDNKTLSDKTIEFINRNVEEINSLSFSDKNIKKTIQKKQTEIAKFLEKEDKLVPKNYYRNLWLPLGMTAFGLPIGIAIGTSLGNIGFLAIGLPIGLALGIGVGTRLDKKAFSEGRQLDVELKTIS